MFTEVEDLWGKAVAFHGHACPGLAIGCRMVMEAARFLDLDQRAVDEEILCVAESDACCVDAVQALLGCTLGKGNLLLKLRGKAAMSFYHRKTGRACRVVWTGIGDDGVTGAEKIKRILSPQGAGYCMARSIHNDPPPEARLGKTLLCGKCDERTAEFMMRPHQGNLYCLDCWPDHSRILP